MKSDERLVRRAQKGDRRAFEAIFKRYHQDLYRFCLSLVGNRQDAEDALQATMVKVLRSLPGEQREIQLRPWIYRIARNESIDTVRRRREVVAVVPEQIVAGPALAETAEARERLGRLIDDLGELPERQRAALVMRELADFEFAEIGSAQETSADAARQAVYEARVSLRQMEAGREMRCDEVVWAISEADGRVVRKREIQAHLRSCADCRAFQDSIPRRRGELRAITPLPIAASTAIIQGALGAGSGTAGGSIAAAGGGAGKALLGSTVVKTAATCAVVAAIGTTAADRSGLVNFPIGVGADSRVREIPTPAAEPTSTHPHQTTKAARPPGSTAARHAARLHRHIAASKTAAAIGSAPGGGSSPAAGPTGNPSPAPEAAGRSAHGGAKPKKNAAKQGQGKAPGLPSSSAHGQQTAAAHKSPHGNAMPGTHQGAANGHSSPPPPAQPTVEPKPEKAAEPPAYGKGGNSAARATGRPTAEAEAEAEAETSG